MAGRSFPLVQKSSQFPSFGTFFDEPTPQDVLCALEQNFCQIQGLDKQIKIQVEESMRDTHGPDAPTERDAQTEEELDTESMVQGARVQIRIR